MIDLYKKLALHLDKMPAGFPATDSGVEVKILKRLFTQDEATIVLGLNMWPEPVPVIAERLSMEPESLGGTLMEMSKKGLIFRAGKDDSPSYMAIQFVIGIWEFNLNRLNTGLIRDVNEYLPQYMKKSWLKYKTKQLRVIPVSKTVTVDLTTMPYETAEEIIAKQKKIVVSDCICRKEHDMVGQPCDYPKEVCLTFGSGAYYYEGNGLGRGIDVEEALAILEKGRQAGLVLQPGNAKDPGNICMCCGCCCQVLANLKTLEQPAKAVHSNYFAQVDADECVACEACVVRCHMDAIILDDTAAAVNFDRCIGCGVCVPVCPSGAIALGKKQETDQYNPPANTFETYLTMAQERGNI
nr:4Fe-4S dicluster domain-containing protein [uncultured Desulfobacter sp.]